MKNNEIELPFNSILFAEAWQDWMDYKRVEHGFKYKSHLSVKGALNKIARLSNNDEDTAIKIIEQSIENGWKGHFKLKKDNEKETKKSAAQIIQDKYGISD